MAKKQQVNNRVAGLAQVNVTNQIAAELVGKIYQAFCKDDKALIDDVKDYLVKNTKSVLLVTSHKCPYILHSVCYLMLGQGCADVLKRMSIENVRVLKECVSVATGRGRPDDESLTKMLQSVDDEIMLQSGTIAQNVSLFWDDVNTELSAWMAEIVEFQRITSNSQNWLNTKEVAARFGKTPNSTFYKDMEKLAELHPEMADKDYCRRYSGTQGNLYNPKHLWQIKLWLDEKDNQSAPVKAGYWTADELAANLGWKRTSFDSRKYQVKEKLKKENPALLEEMLSWFEWQDHQLMFKAEYFEKLKALFKPDEQKASTAKPAKKTTEKPAKKSKVATKKSKKVVKKLAPKPVEKVAEMPTSQNPIQEIVDTHPTDMLGVKTLEAEVATLTKMLEVAEAHYGEILVKLSNAKPAERLELLHQMEQANNEVMAVEKDLDTANALQNEKLAKLEAVRAAEEAKRVAEETERVALAALADVDARAAEFLKQHQK